MLDLELSCDNDRNKTMSTRTEILFVGSDVSDARRKHSQPWNEVEQAQEVSQHEFCNVK